MTHVLANLAAYGDSAAHEELAARTLELIVNPDGNLDGNVMLSDLRRYPALLCYYAVGLGAVASSNWTMLWTASIQPVWRSGQGTETLAAALHPHRVVDDQLAQALVGSRPGTAVSDHLRATLSGPLLTLVDSDERYGEIFDRFEYLLGLLQTHRQISFSEYVPAGYVGAMRSGAQHPGPPMLRDGLTDTRASLCPRSSVMSMIRWLHGPTRSSSTTTS